MIRVITEPETTVVEAVTKTDTYYTVSSNAVGESSRITFTEAQFKHVLALLREGRTDQGVYGVKEDARGFFVLHMVGYMSHLTEVHLTPCQVQDLINGKYLEL